MPSKSGLSALCIRRGLQGAVLTQSHELATSSVCFQYDILQNCPNSERSYRPNSSPKIYIIWYNHMQYSYTYNSTYILCNCSAIFCCTRLHSKSSGRSDRLARRVYKPVQEHCAEMLMVSAPLNNIQIRYDGWCSCPATPQVLLKPMRDLSCFQPRCRFSEVQQHLVGSANKTRDRVDHTDLMLESTKKTKSARRGTVLSNPACIA